MKSFQSWLIVCVVFFVGWIVLFFLPQSEDKRVDVNDRVINEKVEGFEENGEEVDESANVEEEESTDVEHKVVTVEIRLPQVISRVDCYPPQMPTE